MIFRETRNRYIQLSGDITPGGKGLGGAVAEVNRLGASELSHLQVTVYVVGEAERFANWSQYLGSMGLGVMFIFLV